jgi:hypothetical protein
VPCDERSATVHRAESPADFESRGHSWRGTALIDPKWPQLFVAV